MKINILKHIWANLGILTGIKEKSINVLTLVSTIRFMALKLISFVLFVNKIIRVR